MKQERAQRADLNPVTFDVPEPVEPADDPSSPAWRSEILREAKIVGLRDLHLPSLESVERRRLQLWIVTTVLLGSLSAVTVVLSLTTGLTENEAWLSPWVIRLGVIALTMGFCAYAIEKELHLRRLTRLLVDERMLTTALTNRVKELSVLLDAGRAINSVLQLREVLDIILRNALDLLGVDAGSIMLVEGDELCAMAVGSNEAARGARLNIGEGVAGKVASTREPLLINGAVDRRRFPGARRRLNPVDSAMSVPLVHRDKLLGVLNVNASEGRTFSEYDLRAISLFAEQAATAIANARLYEAQRDQVAELVELDRMKSEFVASVSHDLRTPLTTILGAAATARRSDLSEHRRAELLAGIDRQARRLTFMVEQLLATAELEGNKGTLLPQPLDLGLLLTRWMPDLELSFGPLLVDVELPEGCLAMGDEEALRRVVENLVDNAFKYGAPPVRIAVRLRDGNVCLGVMDAGPGVNSDHHEEIFQRFFRIDGSRSGPGMGLGLSIVRSLMTACGGNAWVEDGPDGGAAFWLSLPPA